MPQEILDAARFVMSEAVECRDVSVDHANPLADAVVMALLPWLVFRNAPVVCTARHGLGMGSQDELITCACGKPGWVSVV